MHTHQKSDSLSVALGYLQALENNADEQTLGRFFTADVEQREYPNRMTTDGKVRLRGLAQLLESSRQGRELMRRQRFEVKAAVVDGDQVALRVEWSGELAVPVGQLAIGDTMRAHCAMFFVFRDGRIAEQHNFDCFEPF